MSTIKMNNSPIHSTSIITYPFGIVDSGYSCGWHTGVDFAPYGDTERNPYLYPVKKGKVVYINTSTTQALGVQAQILDNEGHYWRYCHMVEGSLQVNVGDNVDLNTIIGRMGATGNVTGIHLHLECSVSQNWNCSTFLNPCTVLGIPNIDNTIIEYDGSIIPPEPIPVQEVNRRFPWVIYFKKLRNKRQF